MTPKEKADGLVSREMHYVNRFGELMKLKPSKKEGRFLFYHEDCNTDWEEISFHHVGFRYILSNEEQSVLSLFKILNQL